MFNFTFYKLKVSMTGKFIGRGYARWGNDDGETSDGEVSGGDVTIHRYGIIRFLRI